MNLLKKIKVKEMCLYPRLYRNPKYKVTKKNGGNVPVVPDSRVMFIPVGCQRCIECKKQRANEWRVRNLEELRNNNQGVMVTLTFSTKSMIKLFADIPGNIDGYDRELTMCALALKKMRDRWRKAYKDGRIDKPMKYWLIPELGGGRYEHIHMHGIIYHKNWDDIRDMWSYGFCWFGDQFGAKTINYTMKYLSKPDPIHKEYKPKVFVSDGLGRGWFDRTDWKLNVYKAGGKTDELYRCRDGWKLALPNYYRNWVYSEEEREILWLEKLDREERFVLGQKIDISMGKKVYYEVLKEAQRKNTNYGYGGNENDNWSLKNYERQQRNLLIKERLNDYYESLGYKPEARGIDIFDRERSNKHKLQN